jgi:hypothetical protein
MLLRLAAKDGANGGRQNPVHENVNSEDIEEKTIPRPVTEPVDLDPENRGTISL